MRRPRHGRTARRAAHGLGQESGTSLSALHWPHSHRRSRQPTPRRPSARSSSASGAPTNDAAGRWEAPPGSEDRPEGRSHACKRVGRSGTFLFHLAHPGAKTRHGRRTAWDIPLHQKRSVSKQQIEATVGRGMTTAAAARKLKVSVWTIWRACRDHGVKPPPRFARVKGKAEWQQLYTEHGGNISAIARAMCLNRTYITQELERHGIRNRRDVWAEEQVA